MAWIYQYLLNSLQEIRNWVASQRQPLSHPNDILIASQHIASASLTWNATSSLLAVGVASASASSQRQKCQWKSWYSVALTWQGSIMPLPPAPTTCKCQQCHWQRTLIYQSDVAFWPEWTKKCPRCGFEPINRSPATALDAIGAQLNKWLFRRNI